MQLASIECESTKSYCIVWSLEYLQLSENNIGYVQLRRFFVSPMRALVDTEI